MKTLCSFLFRSFQNILRLARIQFFHKFQIILEEDSYNIIPSDYYHKNHHNGYTC